MNFEAMIRAQAAEGKSFDDIAQSIEEALNKVQCETTKVDKRKTYIEGVERGFWAHAKEGAFNMDDVAALALLVSERAFPNWTDEDCKDFMEKVKINIKVCAEMQGKDLVDALNSGIKILGNVMKDTEEPDKSKSKEQSEWDAIKKWIDNL